MPDVPEIGGPGPIGTGQSAGDRPRDPSAQRIDRTLLALAILLGAAARFLLLAPRVFSDPSIGFLDGDPNYQLRRIQYAVTHFPSIFDFDGFVNFPTGAPIFLPDGFNLLLAAIARLLAPTADPGRVEWICAIAIPVLGLAAVLAMYALARLSLAPPGPGAAAFTFAVLWVSVRYTVLGRVDHHVMEPLLLAGAGALCLGAFRRPWPVSIVLGVAAGALASLSCWFVTDGMVVVVLVGGLAAWAAVFQGSPNARLTGLATILAETLVLIALASRTPWGREGTMTYLALSPFQTHLAVAGLGLSTAVILGSWRGLPAGARLLAVAGGIGLGIGALLHGGPSLLDPLREAHGFLSRGEGLESTVLEGMPLWKMSLVDVLVRISPLGLIALPLLILAALRSPRDPSGLGAILALGACGLAGVQVRFMTLGAVGIAWAAGWAAARVYQVTAARPAARRARAAVVVVLVVNGLWPYPWVLRSPLVSFALMEDEKSLAAALLPLRDRDSSLDRPERIPRWGVLAPWRLGHLLVYRAAMPVVASPFGQAPWHVEAVRRVVRFNFSDTDAAAADLCRRLRVRYVVTRDPLVSALNDTRVVGFPLDRYLRASAGGPDSIGLTPYFLRTVSFRLHALDGRFADLSGLQLPALPSFRLVWEAAQPSPTGLPLHAMPHGTRDSYYKLFEVVAGARVEGRCPPGERVRLVAPVRTNIGRSFDWVDETLCDASGSYELRTPYAGNAVRLSAGGREARIAIAPEEVFAGRLVRADVVPEGPAAGLGSWKAGPRGIR